MFQLVSSNPGVHHLWQVCSLCFAMVCSKKPRSFLKAGLTDFSQTLDLLYSTVSWWLFCLPHTTASQLGSPRWTEDCGCGLPARWMAREWLAGPTCADTDQWVAAAWARCSLTQPFHQTPFLQSSASQPLTCDQPGILSFIKVLLAHFSSLSSSIPTSPPSLTVRASLHWLKH